MCCLCMAHFEFNLSILIIHFGNVYMGKHIEAYDTLHEIIIKCSLGKLLRDCEVCILHPTHFTLKY